MVFFSLSLTESYSRTARARDLTFHMLKKYVNRRKKNFRYTQELSCKMWRGSKRQLWKKKSTIYFLLNNTEHLQPKIYQFYIVFSDFFSFELAKTLYSKCSKVAVEELITWKLLIFQIPWGNKCQHHFVKSKLAIVKHFLCITVWTCFTGRVLTNGAMPICFSGIKPFKVWIGSHLIDFSWFHLMLPANNMF